GSIAIGSSGCAGLGNPSWCSGAGTAASPWTINAINSSGVVISTSNVKLQNSYIHASGACRGSLVDVNNKAANVTLSYATIAGNGHSGSATVDVGVFNTSNNPVRGDHLLMFNENNPWEYDGLVSDSYIIVAPGFACTGAHYEPVYNTGLFQATHSVLLNPEEQ